jgi:Fibronectin type III domain/Periplasmic copper-binding protein (NosD)
LHHTYVFSIIVHGGHNMSAKRAALSLASVVFLLVALAPTSAIAITRIVVSNSSQCTADGVTSICYGNLTSAINAAQTGEAIEIYPGTYTGNFTISTSISAIYGTEAASTFISGGGSGTALTIGNIQSSISIQRLNFVSASVGIQANNSPSVTITNNIFQAGPSSTAIQLSASPNAIIANNVFYQDLNGILSDSTLVNVKNNIFSSLYTTAMTASIDISAILNNLFFNCNNIGPTLSFDPSNTATYKGNLQNMDPLFVSVASADVTQRDFHLQAGSPCIDSGSSSVGNDSVDNTTADMGAYGGPNADTIPFQVQGVSAATSGTSITVSWAANQAYTVAGYRVYYGSASGVYNGTGATEGASPITVLDAAATSFTLTGLATAITPSVPVFLSTSPVNNGLVLTWTAAPGASGYKVYYAPKSSPTPSTVVNVPNVTSYTLSNLVNDQYYDIQVSATAQSTYFLAVTAFDNVGSSSGVPGVSHESDYSAEVTGGSGAIAESALSNLLSDFPEALVPYPNLPDSGEGCFIATAAYGYYSAPQVQALRNFRDRFLLTNKPGSAFVAWYYTHGPAAAGWLNEHPQYKPLIRAVLLPAVGMALILTETSNTLTAGLIMITACIIFYAFYRRRLSRTGGVR